MNREKLLRSYEHDIADLKQKLAAEKARADKAEATCAEMRSALLRFKHVDGCFCEAAFDGHQGAHPRHWMECDAAQHALSIDAGKGILEKLKVAQEALDAVRGKFDSWLDKENPEAAMVLQALAALKEEK